MDSINDVLYSIKTDVIYKNLTPNPVEGILSCGFMCKTEEVKNHYFLYYGGFLILSGKGKYIDALGNETVIGPGDFVQRLPNTKHITTVNPDIPWTEFFVCIGPTLYNTLAGLGVISNAPIIKTVLSMQTLNRCKELLETFKSHKESSNESLLLKAQSLLFYINKISKEEAFFNKKQVVINDICDILNRNFDQKLNIKQIAVQYNIGYEDLRKQFKKHTGSAIYNYRIMSKINEGKRLLHYPNLTTKEISAMLGYTDQYAFSNQFKKVVGLSPLKFREIK